MNKYFLIDETTTLVNDIDIMLTYFNNCTACQFTLTVTPPQLNECDAVRTNQNIRYNMNDDIVYYDYYNTTNKITKYDNFYYTYTDQSLGRVLLNTNFKKAIAPLLKYKQTVSDTQFILPYTIYEIGKLGYDLKQDGKKSINWKYYG